jgi:hypothetical protein
MGFTRTFSLAVGVAGLGLGLLVTGPASSFSPALAASGIAATSVDDPRSGSISSATWRRYSKSITDAAVATPIEVVSDLLVPAPSDSRTRWRTIDGSDYVLVSALRYAPISTVEPGGAFTLDTSRWVAIPAQLAQECVRYHCANLDRSHLDLQLKQVLGLPPDADYRYVSQFWVKPSDMFRPCTDPRVASPSCPEKFVGASVEVPTIVGTVNVADFLWAQANYAWRAPDRFWHKIAISCAQSYSNASAGQCYGFPWTRLGYTYDWSPAAKDDVGVTEFVVAQGATAYLERVGTQREFFPFAKRVGTSK